MTVIDNCTGNIAYGKQTQMKTIVNSLTPTGAVDGNLRTNNGSLCTIAGNRSNITDNQWWYVDFGGLFAVFNVTVYPRSDTSMHMILKK